MAVIKKLKAVKIDQNHLLGIQDISITQVHEILKQAKTFITLNKSDSKKIDILRGKTQINLFLNLPQERKVLLNLPEKDLALMLCR